MDSISQDGQSSHERQRVEGPQVSRKGHLPRLTPEHYRGRAFVHWTLTVERRATGWLNPRFHSAWQIVLLHTSARYNLVCPTYVLMPDHVHLIWLGLNDSGSDQRLAVEFLRKHLRTELAPADWQQQVHDHLLRENERERGAFATVAGYVFDNPVRAGLVSRRDEWPYTGACVPGYPELMPTLPDYWDRLWRCYDYLVEKQTA